MNRFLKWLNPGLRDGPSTETKSFMNSMIAWQSAGEANWSSASPDSLAKAGYMKNPVVYRCVRMIGEAAASIAWLLYEGDQELDEHPLFDLLARPNNRQSCQAFMETVYGHLLLHGNAFIQQVLVGDDVREIHALLPQNVRVVAGADGSPVAYEYQAGSMKKRFVNDPLQPVIAHFTLFNPLHDLWGQSPLGAAHMAMDIHNAACRWNKALLDNSARPSGALVYSTKDGGNLTDEQFGRLKSELEDGYTGAGRAGRPLVLEGGLDWKAMGYSPKDMDFMEAKNGASRDIALAFGVPPMLLGIPGDNTYSNYREANRAFWLQTVIPLATRLAGSLSNWLGPQFGADLRLGLDLDEIGALSSDREAHWAKVSGADFLTADEKRAAVGYGPLDTGGDEVDA